MKSSSALTVAHQPEGGEALSPTPIASSSTATAMTTFADLPVTDKVSPPPTGGTTSIAVGVPNSPTSIPRDVLTNNLKLFVLLKVLGSFDSGAFSATLNQDGGIADDWSLSVGQQGTLSSSVFLGNMIGCAVAGHLFSKYSAKRLLTVSLMIHALFTFLFATSESYELAILCRFFIGVTLAFIVVYTPVWVDDFAPKDVAATWMALQNAGVPLGIMMGFVIGGLLPTYTGMEWEWAFFIKAIGMIPIIALLAKQNRSSLDRQKMTLREAVTPLTPQPTTTTSGGKRHRRQRSGESTAGEHTTTTNNTSFVDSHISAHAAQLKAAGGAGFFGAALFHRQGTLAKALRRWAALARRFLRNGVFIANLLSLCSLYFVVSGLQTFVMSYLRAAPFYASTQTIVLGFGCVVVTAPVFGVVAGGVLLDRIGGYHGNIYKASLFGLAWGVGAAVLAVVCVFIETTWMFLFVVWLLLFCGGAIIPPGTGISMASLPESLRPTGSSVSQMACNFLGNFLGPLACGWIAEQSGSLSWGVRSLFAMGVLGVVPMALTSYFASPRRRAKRNAAKRVAQQQSQPHNGSMGGPANEAIAAALGEHMGLHDEPASDSDSVVSYDAESPRDDMSEDLAESSSSSDLDLIISRSSPPPPLTAADNNLLGISNNNNNDNKPHSDLVGQAPSRPPTTPPMTASFASPPRVTNNSVVVVPPSPHGVGGSGGAEFVSAHPLASEGQDALFISIPFHSGTGLAGSLSGTPMSVLPQGGPHLQATPSFSYVANWSRTTPLGPLDEVRRRKRSKRGAVGPSKSASAVTSPSLPPPHPTSPSSTAAVLARQGSHFPDSSEDEDEDNKAHSSGSSESSSSDRSVALEADIANFSDIFPNQHTFGMNVVRSFLNGSMSRSPSVLQSAMPAGGGGGGSVSREGGGGGADSHSREASRIGTPARRSLSSPQRAADTSMAT
jgi:MFS family permease